jgi:hypothetical protein
MIGGGYQSRQSVMISIEADAARSDRDMQWSDHSISYKAGQMFDQFKRMNAADQRQLIAMFDKHKRELSA